MKKIIPFLILCLMIVTVQAQLRTKTVANIQQGQFSDFGGVNFVPADSLQVSDTIAYIIPITHTNALLPYMTWIWNKSGAGTASVTVSFYQGNDAVNFFPVKAGVAKTTYTKAYSLSASGVNEISFARDTAYFEGRYLKVQFLTTATANVKGYLAGRLKSNIQ